MADFLEGLQVCLESSYSHFNNTFYSQVFGAATGSPISSTVANLVMEDPEREVIAGLAYVPHFYKRYIDTAV